MSRGLTGLCVLSATALAFSGTHHAVASAKATQFTCAPYGRIVGTSVHFCGPATAKLSIFPGAVFRSGTCSTKHSGAVVFSLKLGTRTTSATNSGLPFMAFAVTGSMTHPTGGDVVAFWKGKSVLAPGTSFKGTATSGSFTASDKGKTISGSYHC